MINVFRSYNPINILWLGILLFLLRAGYAYNAPSKLEFTYLEPFARLLAPGAYQYAFPPVVNIFLAGVLVFIQALMVNRLVNQYALLSKPSFLPALMYITMSGLFTPFLVLSPPLICNFLLIWMFYKLFGLYKGDDAKSTTYDLGMIVALGSLIYFPFIYLFLVIWAALVLFRPFNWREWIIGVMGYVTIFFFLAVAYYLSGNLSIFYTIWTPLTTKFPTHVNINSYNYLVLTPVILIFILGAIKIRQIFFRSYVQVRKSFQLLFVVFLITGLSFYVKAQFSLTHFLLCVIPVSVFFAYYFLYASARWFYESLFFILVLGIVYFQFNTF
ncbi:DUF6427 family protein [Mucilaginibacter sp. UR6-11]|uniref:DUF6427 family protein n=1 Tax=Mucilaginibacter sp. UR6-11 TaxID=1435644 RepID=UPI001E4BB04C|nr:DUF6427 family protein [Mucilaginibacter sp. UR6-11]MCC8425248.1 DUF6427 family protein [Mucilaginibacter sp. UR6-11]